MTYLNGFTRSKLSLIKLPLILLIGIIFSLTLQAVPHVPGALIIKTKHSSSISTLSSSTANSTQLTLDALNKKHNVKTETKLQLSSGIGVASTQGQTMVLEFNESTNVEQLSEAYNQLDTIEYVEPIYYLNLYEDSPSKSYETNQEYITNTSLQHIYKLNSVNDVIVAIIDSGVDINHSDLSGKIYINERELDNNIDDDGNGFIDDKQGINLAGFYLGNYTTDVSDQKGHGTHLAGIIAANPENNLGIKGITNKVKILPIKIVNKYGKATQVDAAMGIKYAVDKGAKIINCSWGFSSYNQILKEVIAYANQKGATVICASGNGYQNQKVYPAAFENTIAVGSVNLNHYKSDFSNWGDHIDYVFYGENIFSLNTENKYSYRSGTSMATALFSGVCAKILSSDKDVSKENLSGLLASSTSDIHKSGKDPETGNGILDITKLLTNLDSSFNSMFNTSNKSTNPLINSATSNESSDPITQFLEMLLDSPELLAGLGAGLLLISIL